MRKKMILESIEKNIQSILNELDEEKMHKKFTTLVEEALKDDEPEEETEPVLKLDTARIVKEMDYFACLKVSREIEDIVLDSITNYLNENEGTATDEDIKSYLQNSWPELIQAIYERGTSDEESEGEEVEEDEEGE